MYVCVCVCVLCIYLRECVSVHVCALLCMCVEATRFNDISILIDLFTIEISVFSQ